MSLLAARRGALHRPSVGGGSTPSYRDLVMGDGPTVYYRLGEASGTTAVDEVGVYDGTYIGGPTLGEAGIPGASDDAVLLNGSDQHVEGPDGVCTSLEPTNLWTLEAWFKTSSAGTFMNPISFGSSSSRYTRWRIVVGSDLQLNVRNTSDSGGGGSQDTLTGGGGDPRDGQWHHVVAINDRGGEDGYWLYVDGVLEAWQAIPMTHGYLDRFNVGATYRRGIGGLFDGHVDEAAVYPVALSPLAVWNHYQKGAGNDSSIIDPPSASDAYAADVASDSPSFHWHTLEAVAGCTVARDEVNGKHGRWYGSPVSVGNSGPAGFANGVEMDGGQLIARHDVAANANGACTYECWFKTSTSQSSNLMDGRGDDSRYTRRFLQINADGIALNIRNTDNDGIGGTHNSYTVDLSGAHLDGQWHHVVAIFDGADVTIVYDGSQIDQRSADMSGITLGYFAVGGQMVRNDTLTPQFIGDLADVALYSSALTVARAQSHYSTATS